MKKMLKPLKNTIDKITVRAMAILVMGIYVCAGVNCWPNKGIIFRIMPPTLRGKISKNTNPSAMKIDRNT
jgi:hypothetical protein